MHVCREEGNLGLGLTFSLPYSYTEKIFLWCLHHRHSNPQPCITNVSEPPAIWNSHSIIVARLFLSKSFVAASPALWIEQDILVTELNELIQCKWGWNIPGCVNKSTLLFSCIIPSSLFIGKNILPTNILNIELSLADSKYYSKFYGLSLYAFLDLEILTEVSRRPLIH